MRVVDDVVARDKRRDLELDRAIAVIRVVCGLMALAVTVGFGAPGASFASTLTVTLSIVALTGGLNALPSWSRKQRRVRLPVNVIVQVLDCAAAVGLIYLLDHVTQAAWTMASLPILTASLRSGPLRIGQVWLCVTGGYLGLLRFDFISPGRELLSTSLAVERPVMLLAIAGSVAILARLSQENWLSYAELSQDAEIRAKNLTVIEEADRRMRGQDPTKILRVFLAAGTGLGFAATTSQRSDSERESYGQTAIVPRDHSIELTQPGVIEATDWGNADGTIANSVSMFDPSSGAVLTGWSSEPQTSLVIESFASLIGLASMHLEAARKLSAARIDADTDGLTGLLSRHRFSQELETLALAQVPQALLFLDLDDFTVVNDTFGRHVGDEVLRRISQRLNTMIGSNGLLARFGDDEFVIALKGVPAVASDELEQLLHTAVSAPIVIDGAPIGLTTSIGIAKSDSSATPSRLLRSAEAALFDAKAAGRGVSRVRTVTPLRSKATELRGQPLALAGSES